MSDVKQDKDHPDRRGFFAKSSMILGGVLALFPLLAGVGALLDPLRRKSNRGGWIRVASLDDVNENGTPLYCRVLLKEQTDAWTKRTNVPVGAVYLRRDKKGEVKAFNSTCPHLGCAIEARETESDFYCPCHNSTFALDGSISDPNSPSPRSMDTLEVAVENGEVKVRYLDFRAGVTQKIPTG